MKQILVTPSAVRSLLETIGQIVLPEKITANALSDDQIAAVADIFPKFKAGESVKAGDIRNHHGQLYECIQGHTTQNDWQPPDVPALWKHIEAPGVIPEWVQPTGAHDAYAKDAEVTHNGKTWRSLVAANVWEPTVANSTLWAEELT